MTEQEWKDFEGVARNAEGIIALDQIADEERESTKEFVVLAAYRELKERREDEEWLHRNKARVGYADTGNTFSPKKLYLWWPDANLTYGFEDGTTIHAAVLAARGK